MDPSRPSSYRGFNLNNVVLQDGILSGCQLVEAQWLGVRGDRYTEKRAQEDGNDSSDLTQGIRRLNLIGTLYAPSRGLLFDAKELLVAAFSPSLAYIDAPDDRGYQPFYFEEPTAEIADFPSGYRAMFANMLPIAQPNVIANRDRLGGTQPQVALPWAVELEAEDPTRFVTPETEHALSGSSETNFAMANRGTYYAPVDITLEVPAGDQTGTFRFLGFGADIRITFTAGAGAFTLDYVARDRLLWLTDVNGVRSLALEMLSVETEVMSPKVPPGGGTASWSMTGHSDPWTGTLHWFESFA